MKEMAKTSFVEGSDRASTAAKAGATEAAANLLEPNAPHSQATCTAVAVDAVPRAAAIAISDLLDHALCVKAGQKVLVAAQVDGLYGGDNLVDRDAIRWISKALQDRGATPEVLWVDMEARVFEWEFPEAVRAAMDRNDRVILHFFDLTVEEILAFRDYKNKYVKTPSAPGFKTTMVRNFATTAPLLCTAWARTPHELVSEIRHQAGMRIQEGIGSKWELTDPLGSHMTGTILPSRVFSYGSRREDSTLTPWPEWVVPPISLGETSGTFVFDRTLSWWSRYMGVSPYFEKPVQLTIRESKIVAIEGGTEAEALRNFLKDVEGRAGDGVYNFDTMHFGVHPQAHVSPQECPNILHRRMIEHSHSSSLHWHVGSPKPTPSFPYMLHITADILHPTFRVGDTLIYDNGRLTALDHPAVLAVASRYPRRPGLGPEPFHG